MSKKRFAFMGASGRSRNFYTRLLNEYRDDAEMVAWCDLSQVRMDFHNRVLEKDFDQAALPTYKHTAFDQMVAETKPDFIVVTTMDSTHHTYIIKALEAGCDVITEKPMTTDATKCQEIMDAVERTGREVRVTFNYRWGQKATRVKEVLDSGVIGKIRSVNLEYLLNTSHGADYYRRWHSHMDCSGGLLVHKSTHHFDLVNWWVDSIPEEVFAFGTLAFYGKENAIARGDEAYTKYDRYTGAEAAKDDPFAIDLQGHESLKGLYYDAEEETGYLRDQNVFREGIDIYDSMSVNVKYRSGVLLTYSLNSFAPREGERVTFNGDRGRVEFYAFGGAHIIKGQDEEELEAEQKSGIKEHKIVVFPHFKPPYEVDVPMSAKGGHDGADPLLAEQMFSLDPADEHLGRNAFHEQGAASILIGAAANKSIASGEMVKINDLVTINPEAVKLSELK